MGREKSLFFGAVKGGREFDHFGMLPENFSDTSRSSQLFYLGVEIFFLES